MKKIVFNMVCAILLIATGCSHESFVDEQKADERVPGENSTFITLTTRMPDEVPQTRMGLDRNYLGLKVKWEEGDELQLCLKYGDAIEKQVVTITNISADGKTANFSVELPVGDYETFDLYGVYGGGGLDPGDPTKAILSSAVSSTAGSLEELEANKVVMLTFSKTGIERAAPGLSVDLEHLGSLFCIQLRNGGATTWENVKEVELMAVSPVGAHNNTGSAVFDLATGAFSGTLSGNVLTFELPSAVDLAAGRMQEFWGWYVPVSGQNWPAMSLKVIDGAGLELAQSTNSKPARASATPAGKAFYFPAVYDGVDLTFLDAWPLVDIDGNVYTTVEIGDLEWMVENLKVTHYRNGAPIPTVITNAEWSSLTSGAYGVYDYTKTSGVIESEEEMKAQYGLLYNGYAVLDPQGLAPEGWRVATDDDFKALELAVGMTQVNVDKTGTRGTIARKLISTTGWPVSMVGTDDFGFSALPAGSRNGSNGNFEAFYTAFGCRIWTSSVSEDDNTLLFYRNIISSTGAIGRDVKTIKLGYSVRCVRDKLVP